MHLQIDIIYIQNNTVSVDTINSNVLIKNGQISLSNHGRQKI